MTNRILVFGATGKIGGDLVNILKDKPEVSVTVLVRDAEKAKKLFGDRVHIAVGDVEKLETVEAVFKGTFDRVFLLTNSYHIEGKIAALAKASHVKQLVKVSCWLAAQDQTPGSIFAQHAVAEQEVIRTGISWVILRPADFMQNYLNNVGSIKGQGKVYGAHGSANIASIDARDIAASAAAVLTSDVAAHAHRTYNLTGPEALNWTEVAALATKSLSRQVDYIDVGDVAVKGALVSHGVPEHLAYLLVNLSQVYRLQLSGFRWTTGDVEQLTGRKPRSWNDFFGANKASFA